MDRHPSLGDTHTHIILILPTNTKMVSRKPKVHVSLREFTYSVVCYCGDFTPTGSGFDSLEEAIKAHRMNAKEFAFSFKASQGEQVRSCLHLLQPWHSVKLTILRDAFNEIVDMLIPFDGMNISRITIQTTTIDNEVLDRFPVLPNLQKLTIRTQPEIGHLTFDEDNSVFFKDVLGKCLKLNTLRLPAMNYSGITHLIKFIQTAPAFLDFDFSVWNGWAVSAEDQVGNYPELDNALELTSSYEVKILIRLLLPHSIPRLKSTKRLPMDIIRRICPFLTIQPPPRPFRTLPGWDRTNGDGGFAELAEKFMGNANRGSEHIHESLPDPRWDDGLVREPFDIATEENWGSLLSARVEIGSHLTSRGPPTIVQWPADGGFNQFAVAVLGDSRVDDNEYGEEPSYRANDDTTRDK